VNPVTTQKRHVRVWSLPLVCCALVLSACGNGEQAPSPETVLNRGTGDEPESLDVHKSRSTEAGDVQRDLGEGLTGYSPQGEIVAAAAERWEISPDGIEYTFELRPDARWSNGDLLTAADFVFSFRRLVDPATAAFYIQSAGDIENAAAIIGGEMPPAALGAEAVGPHLLKIRLGKPVPYFLGLLTHPSMFPVHRPSIEAHGRDYARPGNLVTNGAFRLVAWEVGSYIEIERNQFYWNDRATAVDRVRHHVTSEPIAELNRYRAAELHTTRTIPPESFAQMKAERSDEVRVSPALGVYYYGFNLTKPPFAGNRKLREALSMAVDRETLVEKITGRGEPPAYGWVPDGTANYDPCRFSYADLSAAERTKKAQQLYREAGFGPDNPLEVELRYNTSDTHQRIALAVQSMWRDVLGVELTLINEEFQVLLENVEQKEITELFRLSWNGDYNDAHTFLSNLESDNPSNMTGYASDVFDSMMERAAGQRDPVFRKGFLEEAECIMLDDHPLIPIYFFVNRSMVSPRVRGWGDNVLNYHYSRHLSLAADE